LTTSIHPEEGGPTANKEGEKGLRYVLMGGWQRLHFLYNSNREKEKGQPTLEGKLNWGVKRSLSCWIFRNALVVLRSKMTLEKGDLDRTSKRGGEYRGE